MQKTQEVIRVVIAVDTRIYREGVSHMLDNFENIRVVTSVCKGDDIAKVCYESAAHVLLLDATFADAISVIKRLKRDVCTTKIIMLAMSACRNSIARFACEGVKEFVTHDDSSEDLRHCIEASVGSGFWCSSRVAELLFNSDFQPSESPLVVSNAASANPAKTNMAAANVTTAGANTVIPTLTPQQTMVLNLIESGYTNKDIARKLNIETATVKNHVHQILQRMQVNTRGEAAAVLRRQTA
ncbi:MAG: two-component system nitrate/nitrite response regulator NarL [Lentisphaeria bacterium]|jgi:two-component system nitrate/nitrite response regulator NarL